MAQKKQIHPSLLKQQNVEAAAFGGGPQHGDEYDDEELLGRVADDDEDDEDEDEPEPKEDAITRQFAEMSRQIGQLQEQNEHLRRSIPPVMAREAAPEPEDEEPDWDEMLFKDPKAALKLHGERVAKSVERNLTKKYETDQSNTRFWSTFYEAHPDLKDDHDLVLATLNKHFSEVGGMRTDLAQEKLADLTRARILKYSGKGGAVPSKKSSRARIEGAAEPRKKPVQPKPENVTSLSSVIKRRRELRYKRGKVA